jgi:hypothetical protein
VTAKLGLPQTKEGVNADECRTSPIPRPQTETQAAVGSGDGLGKFIAVSIPIGSKADKSCPS